MDSASFHSDEPIDIIGLCPLGKHLGSFKFELFERSPGPGRLIVVGVSQLCAAYECYDVI